MDDTREDDRLNVEGILIGTVFGIVVTVGSALLIGVLLAEVLSKQGLSQREIEEAVASKQATDWLHAGLAAVWTSVGGYLAAKRAGDRESLHGLLVGGVLAVVAGVGMLAMPQAMPIDLTVLGVLLMIPAGMIGGFIASTRVLEF